MKNAVCILLSDLFKSTVGLWKGWRGEREKGRGEQGGGGRRRAVAGRPPILPEPALAPKAPTVTRDPGVPETQRKGIGAPKLIASILQASFSKVILIVFNPSKYAYYSHLLDAHSR